jgi:hypothetical protein
MIQILTVFTIRIPLGSHSFCNQHNAWHSKFMHFLFLKLTVAIQTSKNMQEPHSKVQKINNIAQRVQILHSCPVAATVMLCDTTRDRLPDGTILPLFFCLDNEPFRNLKCVTIPSNTDMTSG